MPACFSDDRLQKLAGSVGDFGMVVKSRFALHENADSHNANEAGPIAIQFGADDGQRIHRALSRRFLRLRQVHLRGDRSLGDQFAVRHRQLAADEQEIPHNDGGNISANRFGRLGQNPTQIGELVDDIHGADDNLGKSEFRNAEGKSMSPVNRCPWATTESMIAYHDKEWGVPLHDDRKLFEFLILEGAQAGLSWSTILNRREGYRKAFVRFDPIKVAAFGRKDVARLLKDAGIIRNRLKIESAIRNAKAFLEVQAEFGKFDSYIWQFTGGEPRVNRRQHMREVPARTVESDAMSKDLKRRGFNFVGTTICYAFMQAVGMVNDHVVTCFRYLPD
jgi:DNA-3-methyladenine glycosylase I